MKLPNYLLYIGLFFYCIESGYSQHQELQEKPKIWQSDNKPSTDTTTLLSAFKSGEIHGHFRYYFSNTINEGSLTDYHANAIGGGLRYESGAFHGFNVGVSGFYIFDAGSSDLAAKDNITGQNNRYEIGLFDVTNPENLNEINRLEEFFIKYNRGKTKITFGRQLLNTPFINLQDGRMRPTAAEGLWIEKAIDKNHQFQLGWLYSIAPRSTSKWYNAGESIGLYPAGVDPNGIKSNYTGNTKTKGILLVNYQTKFFKPLTINFWNMWVENVMNTTMLQIDWEHKIMLGKVYASIQGASQVKSGNGGNEDVTKAYFTNEKAVYTFGSKVGWKKNKWDVNINFNRITAGGRYHMPREWGRDYFLPLSQEKEMKVSEI
ncbi:MAG: outer membrane porin, OprD family [Saprospiraceae bacterium]|nr:outer membrane porin, OprD family [Saprospiraceae bacterium]